MVDVPRPPGAVEAKYALMFEHSPIAALLFDPSTLAILDANAAASTLYGYSREELLRLRLVDLKAAEDIPALHERMRELQRRADEAPTAVWRGVSRHFRKDGTAIEVELASHTVRIDGRTTNLAFIEDVTERRRLEEQFRQAQKMEAIGRLAGGIAHDFNNLLNVIVNYAGLAAEDLGADHPSTADLREVMNAARRAGALTKKLLTFSRRDKYVSLPLSLDATVDDMIKLVTPLVGESVAMRVSHGSPAPVIAGDRGQIEQVLMNLVVNARDAMPTGGTLRIETRSVEIDSAKAASLGLKPGPYAVLSVTDTGSGMTPEVRARIFEPFFTTKPAGQGTGLGLATVFGIVKQSGGAMCVKTQPGMGSAFHVYLPRIDAEPAESTQPPALTRDPRLADAQILVVEDEDAVRAVVVRLLKREGYRVQEARDAVQALRIWGTDGRGIDLVLTDVGLPDIDGRELVKRMRRTRPDTRVLLVSGHALPDPGEDPLLAKPFGPRDLIRAVRATLATASAALDRGA